MKNYYSRRELYAAGEPLGECVTRQECGRRIMGGGGGGGTSKTTTEIPSELKPLANAYANKAMALSNQPYQPYTPQRYADLNTTQNLGIGMVQDRALNGDPTVNAGASYLQNSLASGPRSATANTFTMSGPRSATVNPYAQQGNPYLDAAVNKAQGNVLANANLAAARSGSFGNSGIAEQAAKQMNDVATQMYGNAWGQQAQLAEAGAGRNDAMWNQQAQLGESQAGRNDAAYQNWAGNNLNAANLGLQYGNQAYTDAGKLMSAGQLQQDQDQQNRDFGYSQFQEAQNLPYKNLAAMSGVFGSGLGGTTTTTSGGGK